MSVLYISLFIVLALTVLFGWLASKAFKSPIGWVKWLGGITASLLALLFAGITIGGIYGTLQLNEKYSVSVPAVAVAGTPEQIDARRTRRRAFVRRLPFDQRRAADDRRQKYER